MILKILAYLLILTKVFTDYSLADTTSLSIKTGQPKTPVATSSTSINFVALDKNNREITVRCYYKSPDAVGFTQFDDEKHLIPGGNTDHCQTNSNQLTKPGIYSFYTEARIGNEVVKSDFVSLEYNSDMPTAPVSYSKEMVNRCEYKIKFKTANDGKTNKVLLYRSDNLAITVGQNNHVASKNIESDEEGEFVHSVPDCKQNYYFALRSKDKSGNLSDVISDDMVSIIYTSPITVEEINLDSIASTNQAEVLGSSNDRSNLPRWISLGILLSLSVILKIKKDFQKCSN